MPHSDDITELIASLREDIAQIKAGLAALQKELIGNGQPGRIQRIEARLDPLEAVANQLRGMVRAAIIMAGATATAVAGIIVHLLLLH